MEGPEQERFVIQPDLRDAARHEMIREGFEPDFPEAAAKEVATLNGARPASPGTRDLRHLLWSSVDNPESRDLDQVEYVEDLSNGRTKVMVGIADVDSLVTQAGPTDLHAARNTTSVYCGVTMFPMLPEVLSTGLTSLNEAVDRLVVVIELTVEADGTVAAREAYQALIHNHAQLDYPSVGAWLEDRGPAPAKVAALSPLADQLRMQDRVARAMRGQRHRAGALDLETIETTAVTTNGRITDLAVHRKNRATMLIEDFMICANVAMAKLLEDRQVSSIRRVVKAPERWDRMVVLAKALGDTLPGTPDSAALAQFIARRRTADPDHFPDLSLSIVKLMGPGLYEIQRPGQTSDGHFGLAVDDYTHSTAPNRRYADLITQRLVKAALGAKSASYQDAELDAIAARCTKMEDAAKKVERTCRKQAAALYLASRIGETFDAIVTGANAKGTFVRTLHPPAEGMVVKGHQGMDVGDRVRVKLVGANAERGFIDFIGR
jgi:exoribonuclease-2